MSENPIKITLDQKVITIWPGHEHSPAVYINEEEEGGPAILAQLEKMACPSCSLVVLSGFSWDDDLSPWYCPPVFSGGNSYGGKADDYLSWITEKAVPRAEEVLGGSPSSRIVAGYSLAGLLAVYALYRTSIFEAAASMSGSLWYPDFVRYAKEQPLMVKPRCLYFSVGSKEGKTRNPMLQPVEENTRTLAEWYQQQGIHSTFELNPGNHFVDAALRTAKGIGWVLRTLKKKSGQ